MYTLKQLSFDLNMSEKMVGTRLNEVFRLYNIERHWFKESFSEGANSAYAFNEKAYQLLKVLLIALKDYPLVKSEKKIDDEVSREREKSKLEIGDLQKFYATLIPAIDEIADEEVRLKIKQTPIYQKTFLEIEVLNHFNTKFKHFLSASNHLSEAARIELWMDLYGAIDGFIYRAYDKAVERDEEYERNKSKIKRDFEESVTIIEPYNVSPYKEDYRRQLQYFERIKNQELTFLEKQKQNETEYRSLDQFIAQSLILEGYKSHYKNELINLPKGSKGWEKKRYGKFSPKDIEEITKKEEDRFKDVVTNTEQIKRTTGMSIEELKKGSILHKEEAINLKMQRYIRHFEDIELSIDKAEGFLQSKNEKSSQNQVDRLETGYIGMHLENIKSELHQLHEAATSTLYSELTLKEENDVKRILHLAEHFLEGIQLLNKPSVVKEGMERKFYENYIKFYKETENNLDTFSKPSSAFTLSTSIEALDNYKTDKSK